MTKGHFYPFQVHIQGPRGPKMAIFCGKIASKGRAGSRVRHATWKVLLPPVHPSPPHHHPQPPHHHSPPLLCSCSAISTSSLSSSPHTTLASCHSCPFLPPTQRSTFCLEIWGLNVIMDTQEARMSGAWRVQTKNPNTTATAHHSVLTLN